ncbi:MAG: succinylglutamate desuccinylase/aspartoacylase family protein [Burkholderiaceae bacterium]|nr:succinylglutamate desuccinylase/aspartoacylase family protein [Burkholderiaceae bacterium]
MMCFCFSFSNKKFTVLGKTLQTQAKTWLIGILLGSVFTAASISAQARGASERFADLPITVETPAFAAAKRDFTSDAEMAQFIARLDLQTEHLVWRLLGKTPGGREMHLLLFTSEGKSNAFDIAASRKPIVWIIGQQHGNEPAGAEACLEIARRLTVGDLKWVLDRISVVIVPRANPDGAAQNRRESNLTDLNRDHLLLSAPETQLLHRAMRQLPPHVVIDAHEFGPANRWIERFGVAQSSDLLLQSASHPEVAEPLRAVVREVFDPAIDSATRRFGIRTFIYHLLNTSGEKPFVQTGSNFAGIARNTFALYGAVSYLLESRGIGLERQNLQRRVASHVIAMSAILRAAANNPETLIKAVKAARNDWLGEITVDHNLRREMREIPAYEPISGDEKPLKLELQNAFSISPTITRPVPFGYLLGADQAEAAQRLVQHGVRVIRMFQAQDVSVERYIIRAVRQEPSDNGTLLDRVITATQVLNVTVPAGTFYIPINQPFARIAATALEPEGAGSFVNSRLIRVPAGLQVGVELPIMRLVLPARLAGPLLEAY